MLDKIIPKKIIHIFDLIRLDKPIGFMLLLWPCWFALANITQNNFISQDNEVKLAETWLYNNPLNNDGIYYSHDETDITKGYALIIGQDGSPYKDGFYLFKFHFPIFPSAKIEKSSPEIFV